MPSLYTALGLTQSGFSETIPNYGPACLIFNFVLAYAILAPRHLKQYHGIDHNVSPREDLNKYGDAAVREGKITQKQLNMIRRNEAAQANAVENFALLVAAVTMASYAGVPPQTINAAGITYTLARISYGVIYILVDRPVLSLLRSVAWWVGNISCLHLLWRAGCQLS
ncbi:hypothetical protein BDV59DRAFT_177495 [Aspergillus ambiguus]|uniref:MAPEG family protein n=1 Tax=Aspergillus ambiguus TaxID=176160 RepID=UPI003CCD87C9